MAYPQQYGIIDLFEFHDLSSETVLYFSREYGTMEEIGNLEDLCDWLGVTESVLGRMNQMFVSLRILPASDGDLGFRIINVKLRPFG